MNRKMLNTIWRTFVVVLVLVGGSRAGERENLFSEGNRFYQAGNYAAALEAYQKILDAGYKSGGLYYNMGNCYYKLQDVGRAVLFYERAKRLMPGDEDLETNLALANLGVVDQITPRPEFVVFRVFRGVVHLLSLSVLVWIVAVSYAGLMGSLIVWVVSRKFVFRRAGAHGAIVLGVLFSVVGLVLVDRLREERNRVEGVILAGKVDVMSAPNEDTELFSLHEGTKVRVDETSGEWMEIVLVDGKVGWVKQEVLEII